MTEFSTYLHNADLQVVETLSELQEIPRETALALRCSIDILDVLNLGH